MSASNPGPVRRFFRGVWRVVDVSRRVVLNLLFLLILVAGGARARRAAARRRWPTRPRWCSRLDGTIGEQKSRQPALDRARPAARRGQPQKMQLRDVLAVLDAAAKDAEDRRALVLILDELDGRPAWRRCARSAPAVDRFKASGKKVVAWGSSYDQRQYYIAAHADEVYLHPLGVVYITGFGGLRNYYKDALDKLGVTVNVMRVGTFKSFGEPYIANEPSPDGARGRQASLYGALWKTYTDAVEKKRKLARRLGHARRSTRRRSASPRPAATPPSSRSPTSWSTA